MDKLAPADVVARGRPTDAASVSPAPCGASPAHENAGAYLLGLIRPETRSYAERAAFAQRNVRALLTRVGDPHLGLPVVHIAGSKGKGSTALLCEAVLQRCGLRTGTFTSPHLERWTERFRVDGREVEAATLDGVVTRLRPHVQALETRFAEHPPTFFDVLTAAALVLFREARVDVAIVEAGIGALHDATAVVEPVATCITSVEMEHVDKLGPTLRDIARHKAGVIRAGVPLVTGRLTAPAHREIAGRAHEHDAALLRLGCQIRLRVRHAAAGLHLSIATDGLRVRTATPLRAAHLARNAALALACAEASGLVPATVLARAARDAFSVARLPGRVEVLGEQPWLVVDGAHTRESVRALALALARLPARRRHLLLSLSGDKRVPEVLAPLVALADGVTVTCADAKRSLPAAELAAALASMRPELSARVVPDPRAAVRSAQAALARRDLLCATGSMYMAGLARTVLLAQ